jgi:Iron-containing redox enzyme
MKPLLDVEKTIDQWNAEFTGSRRQPLRDLTPYSTEALEWLMMEHYQFSFQNCQFLWNSAQAAGRFDTEAVKAELIRNYNEESGHAAMYKVALKRVGVDVETRKEFKPTAEFLNSLGDLCKHQTPSFILGMMFATETAAIFEHQVFRDVSVDVIARRGLDKQGVALVAFHDLHLSGVEQSHKDELGIFLRHLYQGQAEVPAEGNRPTTQPDAALKGGRVAIDLMNTWWGHLLDALSQKKTMAASS